jgi:putative ABC transport system ATP-binding protein
VARPDVVFADEPTGNLDSKTGHQVLELLQRSVRELDQTVVMVTHDPVAASFADRVVLLADGRAVGEIVDPTPEAVLDRLKHLGA